MAIKRTPRVHWLVLAACLLPVHSTQASWSGFVSMGTTVVIGEPSCTLLTEGKAICAARGLNQTMLVNEFSGTAWSGWKTIAGVITSSPSCTGDGLGNVFCGAVSTTSVLAVAKFNGTAWSALTTVGGQLTSTPSCASFAAGKVVCVARSITGGLTATVFNGVSWGAFSNLAAKTTSAPSCTGDSAGGAICAVVTAGTQYNTVVTRFNGSSWSAFLNLDGIATSEFNCTNLEKDDEVSCFVRSLDSGLYVNTFDGRSWSPTSWSGWGGLGGYVSKPSCAPVSSFNLVCAVIDLEYSALWVDHFNGTSWSGWTELGSAGIGAPSCTTLGNGKVLCSFVGVNNEALSVTGP